MPSWQRSTPGESWMKKEVAEDGAGSRAGLSTSRSPRMPQRRSAWFILREEHLGWGIFFGKAATQSVCHN